MPGPRATLRRPDGTSTADPGRADIAEVLARGDAYWRSGSGDAGLFLDGTSKGLAFFRIEAIGVFIIDPATYDVPFPGPPTPSAAIEHAVCGQPMKTPCSAYHPTHEALDILDHFRRTGQPLEGCQWLCLHEVEY